MKLEKVNENQICCTLTREDLESRQIRVGELAYGSEKAKSLFREMMRQASYELGFEADDVPLMVEAVPMASDSIILLITKVEYPDELDTRFSSFSEPDEEDYPEEFFEEEPAAQSADEVIGLFEPQAKEPEATIGQKPADIVKVFEFSCAEHLERLARVLSGYYAGWNAIYKNRRSGKYELELHKSGHSPKEFNKICNIASEYGRQKSDRPLTRAFFEEHGSVILRNNALELLASISRRQS